MPRGKLRDADEALDFIRPMIPYLQRGIGITEACSLAKIEFATVNRYRNKYPKVDNEIKYHQNTIIAIATDTISTAITTHKELIGKETVVTQLGDAKLAVDVLKKLYRSQWGDNIDITSGGEKIANSFEEQQAQILASLSNLKTTNAKTKKPRKRAT